jgi:hypothetical protein
MVVSGKITTDHDDKPDAALFMFIFGSNHMKHVEFLIPTPPPHPTFTSTTTMQQPPATTTSAITPNQIRRRINDLDAQVRQGLEDGTIRNVMKRIGPAMVSKIFCYFLSSSHWPLEPLTGLPERYPRGTSGFPAQLVPLQLPSGLEHGRGQTGPRLCRTATGGHGGLRSVPSPPHPNCWPLPFPRKAHQGASRLWHLSSFGYPTRSRRIRSG